MKRPRPEEGHRVINPPERRTPQAILDPGPWMMGPLLWTGWLRWFELWLRLCQSLLDGERYGIARLDPSGDAESDRRRIPGAPWLPDVDATVIPLRRRTDPPGSEATRISMRIFVPSLPWDGAGAKVIAVDTLVARRQAAAASQPPSTSEHAAPRPKKDDD